MLVSESTGFSLQVKTEEYAYHLEIEHAADKDCYRVRYGRGVSNNSYYLSNAGWQQFLQKCKEIGVFNWEEIYDFPSFSGYGWFLKFIFQNGKDVSFVGRHNYPYNWEQFVTFLEDFTNQGTWFGSEPVNENAKTQKVLKNEELNNRPPVQETEFNPPFSEQNPEDYKVKLEDLFNGDETETEGKNAFDRQVSKFSTFVKTGSHAFVNLIMDKQDDKKKV